jgi:hypothetical protein
VQYGIWVLTLKQMKKITLIASGLTLLWCSSLGSGAVNPKNVVVALGPWDNSAPEVVGALSDKKWLNSQTSAKLIASDTFKFFSHAGSTGSFKAGKPESLGVPCEETFSVPLTPKHKSKAFEIGVTAAWNPRPRAVTVLPNNSLPYVKVASEFLAIKGLKNTLVKLTSVIKTDFDNDKNDEVFIVGRHYQEMSGSDYFPPAGGKKGDYSFVLMRKIMAGKVQTISLGDDIILKDADVEADNRHLAELYDIAGLLDLNGDGKLEMVAYGAYCEGYSFEIKEWDGKKFVSRASSGCGA